MNFSVQIEKWESHSNRLPSRHISIEKHEALNKMIDDPPGHSTIQSQCVVTSPSHPKASGWLTFHPWLSGPKQAHFEWRLNMRDVFMRIGHKRPTRFAVADLTSEVFQIPLHEACHRYTAFISFWGDLRMNASTHRPTFLRELLSENYMCLRFKLSTVQDMWSLHRWHA